MSAARKPVDVRRVFDQTDAALHASRLPEDDILRVELRDARAAVAELIAADVEYDEARAALEAHYRDVAERGYLEAKMPTARELSERFVRADMRRQHALDVVRGSAA